MLKSSDRTNEVSVMEIEGWSQVVIMQRWSAVCGESRMHGAERGKS